MIRIIICPRCGRIYRVIPAKSTEDEEKHDSADDFSLVEIFAPGQENHTRPDAYTEGN